MPPKTKRAPKRELYEDEAGNPDIYLYCQENDCTIDEAAEAYGISGLKAWRLSIVQEVEHNPELKVNPRIKKDRAKLGAVVVKMRDEEKLRWERVQARTGMSKAELMELYEETTGEEPRRLRGGVAEEEDEAPAPKAKRGAAAKAKPAGRKAKVVEPEDEDDEGEDEAPAARPARRAKARK